ncbi:MAG: tyrosine-type recombinase/integrase [Acidimicrobiales bacterium]|jgi:integrase
MTGFIRIRQHAQVTGATKGCQHEWSGDTCAKCPATRKTQDSFTAYWETKDPSDGRRVQHSRGGFRTRTAAQKHLNSIIGDVSAGSWHPDKPLTVRQLFTEHWLPAQRARGLRPSSLASNELVVEKYLVPALGALRVPALTPADIAQLVEHLRTAKSSQGRAGLSSRTVQIAVGNLKAATAWAARNQLIGRDPLMGVQRPRLEHTEMRSWSLDEARQFLALTASDRLAAIWALLLSRPLRRGEVAGLKWDAIDFAAGTFQIVRTRICVDGKTIDSTPKTSAGRRLVPLDSELITLLRAHEIQQKTERLAAGPAWEGQGHVLCDELGRPYNANYLSDRFDKLVAKFGLRRIRLHDTRHTACSLMLAAGVGVKVVQELAGHSSPQITLALYAHTTPSMGREAGEALSASLLGS